ncbi:outer membrane protein TOM13-domain-containing protein [Scheffersomyces coipomensis]|uniref:outer membrane protein TOM13-domain-containing protein n=1 Tax=Scheffersomyces coipomensis TaxID=1788519 RepID=UPI00315CFE43
MSSSIEKEAIRTPEEYSTSGLSESEETVFSSNRESNIIFAGSSKDAEVDSVPAGVDALTESNDLTVLETQMSSDEIVNDSDILKIEELIKQSKQDEQDEEEVDYEVEETSNQNKVVVSFNILDILIKGSINLVLPFINGMMLGFGEILAHEIGFRYNWFGARVTPPRRMEARARQNQSKFL